MAGPIALLISVVFVIVALFKSRIEQVITTIREDGNVTPRLKV
jgi:hypothetical protein